MAKIAIKSEIITSFGKIYDIMDVFSNMSIFAQNGGPPDSCEGLCLPEEQEVMRLMLEKVRADSNNGLR